MASPIVHYTRRADLSTDELAEVTQLFTASGDSTSTPTNTKVEVALDALTRPRKEIDHGLSYVTLGNFVAGAGNVVLLPDCISGDVLIDHSSPDGLYLTTLEI